MTLVTTPVTPPARRLRLVRADVGAVSAEYAVATVAACGFAGILWKILSSQQVLTLLVNLFSRALSWLF
jgi:hypothetical protein